MDCYLENSKQENKSKIEISVAIDASRNRSGGAIAHLKGILEDSDPSLIGIKEVHVWTYHSLSEKLPNRRWLIKHTPKLLEKSIFHQVFWQRWLFAKEFRNAKCDILLNTDAGTTEKRRSLLPSI